MKKRGLLLIVGVFMCCLSVLAACNSKEKLPVPDKIIKVEYQGQMHLTWEQVPYSTGGYLVEIAGKQYPTEVNLFSLSSFQTGSYTARVKAITIDPNYYVDSDWSEGYDFSLEVESGVTYNLINDNTEYEVYRMGTARDNITIFSTYNGKPITRIAEKAFAGIGASNITGIVVLGNNLTEIADSAFAGCSRLESVVLPNSVTRIGDRAFENTRMLKSITLPSNLTYLGESAFEGSRELTSITIPDGVKEIPKAAFSKCSKLTSVTLHDSIESIGELAFYYTQALPSIKIPASVQVIGADAFNGSAVSSVELNEGLKKIAKGAFFSTPNLLNIATPNSLIEIGADAFKKSALWNAVTEEQGVVYADKWVVGLVGNTVLIPVIRDNTIGIGDFAFTDTKIEDIVIPSSVRHVGLSAFLNTPIWKNSQTEIVYVSNWIVGNKSTFKAEDITSDTPIRNLTIEDGTIGISDSAFLNLELPFRITFNNDLKYIGSYAFFACQFLVDSIIIPEGVTFIGEYAFAFLPLIVSAQVPESITELNGTFRSCYDLAEVRLPSTLVSLGDYTFYSCGDLTTIYTSDMPAPIPNEYNLPSGLKYIGDSVFVSASTNDQNNTLEINLPDSLEYIGSSTFAGINTLQSISIPEGVTALNDSLFSSCIKLKSIEVLGKVTYIGEMAFLGCYALVSFDMPQTVTFIGIRAFAQCYALKSIVVPEGVTIIKSNTFSDCVLLESIVLPSTIVRIEDYAFYGCKALTNIVFPKALKSISRYAFVNCISLQTITISKDVIGVANSVFYGCYTYDFNKNIYTSLCSIYTDDRIRPSDWSISWNSSYLPVVWDCVLSEDRTYVVSFTMSETSISNPPGENYPPIADPHRVGYEFAGWTTNASSVVYDFLNVIEVPQGVTVYAIWIPLS